MVTRPGARPASFAAIATAHAPLPHAIVSPLPRSQTRTLIASAGDLGELHVRVLGEQFVALQRRTDVRDVEAVGIVLEERATRCGLPMDTALAVTVSPPPMSNGCSRKVSHAGPRIGIAAFVKLACPSPTVTRSTHPSLLGCRVRCFTPARVSTSNSARR